MSSRTRGNTHPVHGYPSKGAAIRDLSARGLTHEQIAARLGISAVNVSTRLTQMRLDDKVGALGGAQRGATPGARFGGGSVAKGLGLAIEVRGVAAARLELEARKRGQTPAELANDIVSVVIADALFAAVLDR
jgi:hypothetical protein